MLKEREEKDAKKDQLIENPQAQLEYLKNKLFGSTSEIRRDLFLGQMNLFDTMVMISLQNQMNGLKNWIWESRECAVKNW